MTHDLIVTAEGALEWRGQRYACALGAGGVVRAKREGDGATPAGCFALRRVPYRPDRLAPPKTRLPLSPLNPRAGWCDDPEDPLYNQPIRQPYGAHFEVLWRDDGLYDVILVLGYNDAPVVVGRGSAIFLHIAKPDLGPTEGCVALARGDLLELLAGIDPRARLRVLEPGETP